MPRTITPDTVTLDSATLRPMKDADGQDVIGLSARYNVSASSGELALSREQLFAPAAGSPAATRFRTIWDQVAAHIAAAEGI